MEEHRNTVINSHAIQSQNISKFTGDISKNTSEFTSKSNQIRLGGHGGATPPEEAPKQGCPRAWAGLEEPRQSAW